MAKQNTPQSHLLKQTEGKSADGFSGDLLCLFFRIRLPKLSVFKATKAVSIDKKHCVSPAESPSVSFPQQAVLSLSLYSYLGFHTSKNLGIFHRCLPQTMWLSSNQGF